MVFPNYNQQDATFLDLFIYTDVLHVSGGSSAVMCSVQLCAPDDGRRNRLKYLEHL